jgi:hypothetical protein
MVARHAVAVVTLLSFSPALAENLDAEAARRFIVGKLFAFTCADGSRGVARGMRFTAPAGSGVPSFVPRALAAARAALVRSEMASRSCSATAARIWIVSLLAWGLSTATNSTPESMSVATACSLHWSAEVVGGEFTSER